MAWRPNGNSSSSIVWIGKFSSSSSLALNFRFAPVLRDWPRTIVPPSFGSFSGSPAKSAKSSRLISLTDELSLRFRLASILMGFVEEEESLLMLSILFEMLLYLSGEAFSKLATGGGPTSGDSLCVAESERIPRSSSVLVSCKQCRTISELHLLQCLPRI